MAVIDYAGRKLLSSTGKVLFSSGGPLLMTGESLLRFPGAPHLSVEAPAWAVWLLGFGPPT